MSKVIDRWETAQEAMNGAYAAFAGFERQVLDLDNDVSDAWEMRGIEFQTALFGFVTDLLMEEAEDAARPDVAVTNLLNSLDCECDEYHGHTCGLCLARREWAAVQATLVRLSAPRPAPRCPICGHDAIELYWHDGGCWTWCCYCKQDGEEHETLDAALDAWRAKP